MPRPTALMFLSSLLMSVFIGTASAQSVLGFSSPPLHLIVALDMTGSSKNPAFQYAAQARLIAQNVLLSQLRSGDSVTLLQVCSGVRTIADFKYQAPGGERMNRADILRYSAALTAPCQGKGSAITAGFAAAQAAVSRTPTVPAVVVYFTDGALIDDPGRAGLGGVFGKLLGKGTACVFIAGLSPEPSGSGGSGSGSSGSSVRDGFTAALGKTALDARVILAGAYDLNNVYPSFAAAVKAIRR
ncbi:VWA domain-containing protein [Deinococcus sp.]|uniref:VWA domain-containing protein n=1 Tax=Deinococcus sp. TaxID=47478 RepID=UPI0025DA72B5|nr:VWA domain-containing protein [Deinococcus sp.]